MKSTEYGYWLGDEEFASRLDEFKAAINWYEKNVGKTNFYEFEMRLVAVAEAAKKLNDNTDECGESPFEMRFRLHEALLVLELPESK